MAVRSIEFKVKGKDSVTRIFVIERMGKGFSHLTSYAVSKNCCVDSLDPNYDSCASCWQRVDFSAPSCHMRRSFGV